MAYFRKVKAGLVKDDIESFVGEIGNIFFNIETGELRLSDGVTPGGIPLAGGGGGGYVLPTASTTVKGGVKVDGTTIKIVNQVISGFSGSYSDLDGAPSVPTTLDQLTDVIISSPAADEVLTYDATSSAFRNRNLKLTGGAASQVLVKQSNANYDYRWEDMIINLPDSTYTKLLDQASSTVLYLGEAAPESLEASPVWRIQKILFKTNGDVESVRFADAGLFDQVWNNRAALTYV